jgi:hypothetical protein
VEFKREFGHCNVPRSYERNPPLGNWCNKQKKLFNNINLSDERTDKLNELGFEWNIRKRKREDICEQLSVDGNEENTHPNNNIIVENNLANEEHIVKKSKTHQDKSAGSKRRSTVDERCERLAKQIVGMIGQNARTILNPACNIEHFLRTRLGG